MASCMGVAAQNGTSTQIPGSSEQPADSLPAQWDLQACIDYALQQNITIRKNRLNAESAQVDVKTARAALFPSLSASVSQRVVNRPKSETNTIIDGDNITSSQSKTSYNGSYGIDANWTLYNGGKRLNTIKQQQLNNRIAELSVAQSENSIEESIAQTYVQILYAAEAVKVNESTLEVSQAECERARQLLEAGSIAKSDLAQLEAQVSTDKYQLVTAQATLQDYKLQLKQLLELDGESEMNLYIPTLGTENVLAPLPTKTDVYRSALVLRPEIEAGKLNIQTSDLDIKIARAGYLPTLSLSAGIGTSHANGNDFTFSEHDIGGIAIHLHPPFFHPDRPCTQCLDLIHGVRAKENRLARLLETHDAVKRLARERAIAHRQCLINDQNIGIGAGGDRKCQPHIHAT